MLRLGNIDYSNCYPIHGPILESHRPDWLVVVDGTPTELNLLLARGELDIAPGSSIELARHSRECGALGGLCIGSDGPVESIVLVTRRPLEELHGRPVALPTASATSRCLLRILLETRLGVRPEWEDFDQATADPLTDGGAVDAALFIGDVALCRSTRHGEEVVDLGREWTEWTGLPFVYALWLVRNTAADRAETSELHRTLLIRRDRVDEELGRLAAAATSRYRLSAERLRAYWSRIRYGLDEDMMEGLELFMEHAARLGEAPRAPSLRFLP